MDKKIDKRAQKTRNALQNALAVMLDEKVLRKITVQEVADLADINRVTFYKHYNKKSRAKIVLYTQATVFKNHHFYFVTRSKTQNKTWCSSKNQVFHTRSRRNSLYSRAAKTMLAKSR